MLVVTDHCIYYHTPMTQEEVEARTKLTNPCGFASRGDIAADLGISHVLLAQEVLVHPLLDVAHHQQGPAHLAHLHVLHVLVPGPAPQLLPQLPRLLLRHLQWEPPCSLQTAIPATGMAWPLPPMTEHCSLLCLGEKKPHPQGLEADWKKESHTFVVVSVLSGMLFFSVTAWWVPRRLGHSQLKKANHIQLLAVRHATFNKATMCKQ